MDIDNDDNSTTTLMGARFDLAALYESVSEGVEDERTTVSLALKLKVREALAEIASLEGYKNSEFFRRALFFAMMNPAALRAVDDQEAIYKSLLQHNGWNS